MNNFILKYPLDLRGNSAQNLVLAEPHTIAASGNRAFVLNYGPFFTEGLVVRDLTTGLVLERETQYKAIHLYQEAVLRTGLEVCSVVVIVDDSVSTEVSVDYQVVGGDYSLAVPVIQQALEDYEIDNREVNWGDLIALPDAFPPVSHLHDAGDLYGFEYVVSAIEQLRSAIIVGDEASHQELRDYTHAAIDEYDEGINPRLQTVESHTTNTNNPHAVTKAQVGLPQVENYQISTRLEAEAGALNNRYMTPLRTKQAIDELAGGAISGHTNDINNPHNVTKVQIGLGNVQNYGITTQGDAQDGTVNTGYMTPLRTAQAIDARVGNAFNAHNVRTDNPHSVTKSQVGLNNVQNFGIASQAQAETGTLNTVYMTPLRTADAITALAGAAISGHVNDTGNPHNVTAAQVGLGNVQNYGVANQTQAETGTDNSTYMTPLRTRQAIEELASGSIGSHVNDVSNPHNVTKVQIGLGNVQNYGIATQGDAETGTVNTGYMTPLRTAQAIDARIGNTLSSHVSSISNPHNVTKTQVGLGNVQNYPTSTQSQATTGDVNSSYMTPLRVKQAIDAQVLGVFDSHVNDTNNPHEVDKADVGLGNVENYPIATLSQALGGSFNTAYMTPLRTRQAVEAQFGSVADRLDEHLEGNSNDHDARYALISDTAYTWGRVGVINQVETEGVDASSNFSINYVDRYPPFGFTMDDIAFITASIGRINFGGSNVDDNDTLWCNWSIMSDRIRFNCQNSENRGGAIVIFGIVWNRAPFSSASR